MKGKPPNPWGKKQRYAWKQEQHSKNPHCFYCGVETLLIGKKDYYGSSPPLNNASLDHYHPLAKGGKDEPDNWRLTCRQCNEAKGDAMPDGMAERPRVRDSVKVELSDGFLNILRMVGAA